MAYNTLLSSAVGHWPLQDDAASTVVVDEAGSENGTLVGGDNTADITTTGPNTWLTAALHLDGTSDYITLPGNIEFDNGEEFTVVGYTNRDVTSTRHGIWALNPTTYYLEFSDNTIRLRVRIEGGVNVYIASHGVTSTAWHEIAYLRDSSDLMSVYVDGSVVTTDITESSIANTADHSLEGIGVRLGTGNDPFDGLLAGFVAWDFALSSDQIEDWNAGPEPQNNVTPVISGTAEIGETLSVDDGDDAADWGLPDPFSAGTNGTITVSYQWVRNGVDISGATSSTYVVASPGDHQVRLRGTNDGGFDANEDVLSNTISVPGGGGAVRLPWMGMGLTI